MQLSYMFPVQRGTQCALLLTLLILKSCAQPLITIETNAEDDRNANSEVSTPVQVQRVILREFEPLTLNCTGPSRVSLPANWTRDGTPINATMSALYNYQVYGNGLTTPKVNSTYVGDYECWNGPMYRARFAVRTKPRVMFNMTHMERSQTVTISGRWAIDCKFVDLHYARDAQLTLVRCASKQDATRDWCGEWNLTELQRRTRRWIATNQARITLNPVNRSLVTLSIEPAHYTDTGVFVCFGTNAFNSTAVQRNNVSVMLRIRDRYDYNWPLVLLSGLALYLFGLVAIFETRRIRATSFLKFDQFVKVR